MKIAGRIIIDQLGGHCATCLHYKPLIYNLYGIETQAARGKCTHPFRGHGRAMYKQRTEWCAKWEKANFKV